MSWNPENNTVDISKIIENLFGFLETNQTAVLAWANAGTPIAGFKKFYPSARGRVSTIFPCIMLVKKSVATDFSSDVLKAGLRLLFEGTLQGGNADQLVDDATTYARAVESMLINIDPQVLTAGVFKVIDSITTDVETEYDVLRGNKPTKPTVFLQSFQTEITYLLQGNSY